MLREPDQAAKGGYRYFTTCFFIGAASGGFGGLLGLGGGIVMVPMLARLLGMSQHKAHGTSLAALILTGASGAAAYSLSGSVDIAAALFLAIPAIITAGMGARYAHSLPAYGLKRKFGWFMLFIAILLLAKPYLPVTPYRGGFFLTGITLGLAGAFTGFLSGMMGVGGGSLMVPAMVLLAGMDQHTAQGSSLLAMVPAGISGAKTHWKLGNVQSDSLRGLFPGIAFGSFAGGYAAGFLPDGVLRSMFAAMLVWFGIKYIRAKQAG